MEMKEKVREIVAGLLEKGCDVEDDTLLKEVGLNSINFIQMVVALEEEFDIEFDEEELVEYQNISINRLCEYVNEILSV